MKYVNKRMVVVINRLSMRMTDGGLSISSTNLRDGADLGFVDNIFYNSIFGEKIYYNVFEMAGAYLFYICKNHIFMDGNKRTALASALTFLQWNNIEIKALDEDSVFDFVIDVASGPNLPELMIPKIAAWLKDLSIQRAQDV